MKNKRMLKVLASGLLLSGILGLASCQKIQDWLNPTTSDIVPTEEIKRIQVSIFINGGKVSKTIEGNETINLNDYVRIADDMVFDGWFYDENYTLPVDDLTITSSSSYFNFYAKTYKAEKSILTINALNNKKEYSIVKGSSINLDDYIEEIDGYKFAGWYSDSNYKNEIKDSEFVLEATTTLYAKYDKLASFNINIYINGEKIEKKINSGFKINISDFVDVKDDEILTGWYSDESYTSRYPNIITVNKNYDLYVELYKREDINYNIYIDGSEISNKTTINSYLNLNDYTKTKEHFVFDGWYYDENFTQKIDKPERIKLTKDMNFYAKYIENAKTSFELIFKNGDTLETVQIPQKYYEEIYDLSALKYWKDNQNILFDKLYADENKTIELEVKEYTVENLVHTLTNNKIYVSLKCPLEVYAGDALVHQEYLPYKSTYNAENYKKYCGENYRVDGIETEQGNLTALGKEVIKLKVHSYMNYSLYDSFEYKVESGKITITKYTGNNAIVQIPSIIENKQVAKIGSNVFDDTVVKVVIPQTVTSVDSKAFDLCKKLIEVYNLSSVNIATNNTRGPLYVYNSLNYESKISQYNDEYLVYADNGQKYLLSYLGIKPKLTLPTDIDGSEYKIYRYAFTSNKYINTIIVPEGIESISSYSFGNMTNLVQIRIPSTLKKIETLAFEDCHKLLEIYNDSDLDIQLNSYEFGGIAGYAKRIYKKNSEFSNYFRISYEDINSSEISQVGYLVYDTGEGPLNLIGISYSNTDIKTIVLPESLEGKEYNIFHHAFSGANIKELIIPENVIEIGDNAFEDCSQLVELNLGNIQAIGSNSFANCYRLSIIDIPASVKTIGAYAFSNCTNAIHINIANGVEAIGASAFANCSTVATLTIPDSVISMDEKALSNMSSLTSLIIPFVGEERESRDNFYFGYIFGGVSNTSGTINTGIPSSLKTLTITDDIALDNQAFWKVNTLSTLIVRNTQKIGISTFGFCTNLETIAFEGDTFFTDISSDSFYGSTKLSIFKTNKLKEFFESETMMKLYTQGLKLQTLSDVKEIKTTSGIITETAGNPVLDAEKVLTDFEIILNDGTVYSKEYFDEIIALDLELGNTNNFGYTYVSKPKTIVKNNEVLYDEKAQEYTVSVEININRGKYTGYSETVKIVESVKEEE